MNEEVQPEGMEEAEILPATPAKLELKEKNPSVTPAIRVTEETRIAMSAKTGQLQVPEIPGYHLHWGHSKRISRMLRAGYEFVEIGEVEVNNMDWAGDMAASGNTDMGSRISLAAGEDVDSGRLYLMKLREEWWDKDREKIEEANEKIASGIRGGKIGEDGQGDHTRKYLKQGQELFVPQQHRKFK